MAVALGVTQRMVVTKCDAGGAIINFKNYKKLLAFSPQPPLSHYSEKKIGTSRNSHPQLPHPQLPDVEDTSGCLIYVIGRWFHAWPKEKQKIFMAYYNFFSPNSFSSPVRTTLDQGSWWPIPNKVNLFLRTKFLNSFFVLFCFCSFLLLKTNKPKQKTSVKVFLLIIVA